MKGKSSVTIGINWCLAWGNGRKPQFDISVLREMCEALRTGGEVPAQVRTIVQQVEDLQKIEEDYFPDTLEQLKNDYPDLWNQTTNIGLVYGGVTKVKQYVFESAKIQEVRGASALLDRINLIDLPAFFGDYQNVPQKIRKSFNKSLSISQWLGKNFPGLEAALIPELIIYSTGGNILAFCPSAFVDDLANAIEKRYTHETLTANSCAVGAKFKPLEIKFGLLNNSIEKTFWLEQYNSHLKHELIKAYFNQPDVDDPIQAFQERKSFNELVGRLASLFNKRRNGNNCEYRASRCYPPIFETHPYLIRDEGDRRSAVMKAEGLPNEPYFSETLARKRIVGQISKRDDISTGWYYQAGFNWEPNPIYIPSWVQKFEDFLDKDENKLLAEKYYNGCKNPEEARSLIEVANASKPRGFVAYIYADGNNMGGYIQKIKTPQQYQQFSHDIFEATEQSVYHALAKHLHPHQLKDITEEEKQKRNGRWIHPFEILTIGGDDVMLIVPADKALAIAQTIGEEFERILLNKGETYKSDQTYKFEVVHRYHSQQQISTNKQCKLSMSTGVLITAEDTPIYYAEKLTNQLLKSAKKQAKELKKYGYCGGTVDFLVMKSVTMISSNISEFRTNGLTKTGQGKQKLKLYAAPYTLHELGGLLKTAQTLIDAEFPKSQLYQIRSLLERGKQTAILNYRYFRVRLNNKEAQKSLEDEFENKWCLPKDKNNNGNLAPWMSLKDTEECEDKNRKSSDKQEKKDDKVTYETIWRELVDLYPFFEKKAKKSDVQKSKQQV
ncbi:type III-B CRISPR-associated protein Cas10/Cmr2 [Sphaerospermopsis torques-reginae]|uniref:Type III-B CRISPR-associated protein Cas10/Cmr2 n=1 Tax=Sphaerospermopsis torques-reginae ITEP-024 TaxID=984208 RepID=A0ABX8X5K2_9CYAN|nr:type III-B CRISPR-associated protein Cas10/Cmr2 [Sphaerospermopsis torques-reginae]QYX33986.1 type III-B CRISPR-associated protein Cas10/Cmr2 [Sphaerospermopsis torques-reginae ITEP-024]